MLDLLGSFDSRISDNTLNTDMRLVRLCDVMCVCVQRLVRLAFTFDERKNAAVTVTASAPLAGIMPLRRFLRERETHKCGLVLAGGGSVAKFLASSRDSYVRLRSLSAFQEAASTAVRCRHTALSQPLNDKG